MPYTTKLPDGVITIGTDGLPIVNLGTLSFLNDLGTSQPFDQYDVPGDQGPVTLENGDDFSLVNGDGTPVDSGTYMGDVQLSTAAVDVGIPGPLGTTLAGIEIAVNPVDGELYQDENGDFYMISDDPIDDDHLGVTLKVEALGATLLDIEVPISGIFDALEGVPILGPIINDVVAPLVQAALDTVVVSYDVDPTGTLEFNDGFVPCFASGTEIATENGNVAVDNLKVGDTVLTRDNEHQTIRWIGKTELGSARLRHNPKLRPICIEPGALGRGLPAKPLVVSPQHRILVSSKIAERMFDENEIFVPAVKLLELDGVSRIDSCDPVTYYHILLDRHEVIYAASTPAESLYMGQQALRAVSDEAKEEIFELFPELGDPDHTPRLARSAPKGRQLKNFVQRHVKNNRPMLG